MSDSWQKEASSLRPLRVTSGMQNASDLVVATILLMAVATILMMTTMAVVATILLMAVAVVATIFLFTNAKANVT